MKLIKPYSPSSYPDDIWFEFNYTTYMLEWGNKLNKYLRLV